jgi:hypothetical protein
VPSGVYSAAVSEAGEVNDEDLLGSSRPSAAPAAMGDLPFMGRFRQQSSPMAALTISIAAVIDTAKSS